MNRHRFTPLAILVLALVSLWLGSAIGGAASSGRAYLPVVANGAPAAVTLTTLVDHDTGFVSAVQLPDGRVILGYQDRVDHGRVHIVWDLGDHVAEVKDVTGQLGAFLALTAQPESAAPDFTFPGPKAGPLDLIVVGVYLDIYAPARNVGDAAGPFPLKRLRIPLTELS